MINQIGVNWMQLSASQIIYLNGHEYWAAPTTINYPTNDWISHHLIYTHAARIIVIDSHTGDYVSVPERVRSQSGAFDLLWRGTI